MVDVHIDTRESKGGSILAYLIEEGINTKMVALPAGDYLIFGKDEEKATLIERKTAPDFLGSIEGNKNSEGVYERGRIWDQLKRMKETKVGELTVAIIGNPFSSVYTAYRKKGFTKERIWGSLRGIRRFGVGIERFSNEEDFAKYLLYLANSKGKPKKEFSLRTSASKHMTPYQKKMYVLQGLPKIGPKTSRAILKEHVTVMNFLKNVKTSNAIGKKAKEEIQEILTGKNGRAPKKGRKKKKS